MRYKLGWCEAVKVIFIGEKKWISTFFISLFAFMLFFPIAFLVDGRFGESVIMAFAFLAAGIVPFSFLPLINHESGWEIKGDYLEVNAFGDGGKLYIPIAEIVFVDKNGKWSPDDRISRDRFAGILLGDCYLHNKKHAVVFQLLNKKDKLLMIVVNEKYYLIGHPGVELLYEELIRLGATLKEFDNE